MFQLFCSQTHYSHIFSYGTYITPQILYIITSTSRDEYCLRPSLSLFSSHRKNWFAARCEYLHLIKKNSHRANCRHCEFFLIRCKHSLRTGFCDDWKRGFRHRSSVEFNVLDLMLQSKYNTKYIYSAVFDCISRQRVKENCC